MFLIILYYYTLPQFGGGVPMPKKGLSHLLEPSFRLYFIFLAFFAVASAAVGQYQLALAEGLIVLVLFVYFQQRKIGRAHV